MREAIAEDFDDVLATVVSDLLAEPVIEQSSTADPHG